MQRKNHKNYQKKYLLSISKNIRFNKGSGKKKGNRLLSETYNKQFPVNFFIYQ